MGKRGIFVYTKHFNIIFVFLFKFIMMVFYTKTKLFSFFLLLHIYYYINCRYCKLKKTTKNKQFLKQMKYTKKTWAKAIF